MKIEQKVTLFFTAVIICGSLFTGYLWLAYKSIPLLIVTIIFCMIIVGLSGMLVHDLKRYMEQILNQLSLVISSIMDMNANEVFSVLNDDMLSKLQSQVIKLSNILKAQNSRVKSERDEIKSLISDISHQLKTPLSNLKLYNELLQDPSISKEDHLEFSRNMQSQIQKLCFLMDNMIKMSRLEGGIIKLVPQQTSLNNICLSAVKQTYQKAQNKNIEIQFQGSKDILLNLDNNWTTEALFNIIDNAIKYTLSGGMIIIETAQYEMFARVDITDNGIGIDEKEINNIFKRFFRGEHCQAEEGVGLGLYLAREIISKQHGYIKVKSIPTQGSTFSVFLPLR